MGEILYLRKQRLKDTKYSDYRTLFRFKKENVHWLATLILGEGSDKEYFTSLQKMKLCLKFLGNPAHDDENPVEHYIIDAHVSNAISTVIDRVVAVADNWVKFPQTQEAVTEAKEDWLRRNKFPTAIGVVDCSHFRVKKSDHYTDEYKNREGVYSVNVQATCDSKGMFTSVDTRWPGSVEDNSVWRKSIIRHIMGTTRKTVLLADEAYNTEPWLMTPFPDTDTSAKANFNKVLKRERSVIDRCFSQVKRRFPILRCVACMKHETASDIITACFVLHNIAKHLGEENFVEDEWDEINKEVKEANIRQLGCEVRDNNEAYIRQLGCDVRNNLAQFELIEVPATPTQMMSNTSSSAYTSGLQQHSLSALPTIDFLNQNGPTTLTTYPSAATQDTGILLDLDKQATVAYYAPPPPPPPNPTSFFSTQLVQEAPGTILITSNFGPDEASKISGVNNNFNNSSIRIVTHNNNNNANHTNNNNTNIKLECNISNDKQPQQHYHHHHLHPPQAPTVMQHPPTTTPPSSIIMPNSIVSGSAPGPTTTSTVLLDRINICINNHYGDTGAKASASAPSPPSEPVSTPVNPPVSKKIVDKVPPSKVTKKMDEPDSTTPTHCLSERLDKDSDDGKSLDFDLFSMQKFDVGEDALVQRRDGRYYLGTIVDIHRQQYLVQFDDNTDYWSNGDELIKLSTDIVGKEKATCLSCKRENDDDVVEICDRCGRGYHRLCTEEVSPNSGEWMCKRCEKPMKQSAESEPGDAFRSKHRSWRKVVKQFPYALDSLTWDEKHRVNEEQIYCYCGKSGQFDNNMIQCCKCKQWFHSNCVDCVRTLFRGDVFFIFACSVCNNGKEFLRRIEMEWVDFAHLVLYNMAIMKNFQKYHHLHKDIYPFALEKRIAFQLPSSMLNISDSEFKTKLLNTLQMHPTLFQCGKEIKKDHSFWGLRSNRPPQGPTYEVKRDEVLCNHLIRDKLKINILPYVEEEDDENDDDDDDDDIDLIEPLTESTEDEPLSQPATNKEKSTSNTEPERDDEDDDKFTSDDEIPIKLIIEKVKTLTSALDSPKEPKPQDESGLSDLSNDQSNGGQSTDAPIDEKDKKKEGKKDDQPLAKVQQKSSRKRKAFTLSKGYKDSDKSNDLPRNICDSSSDENSSSSRGTLDLIIPQPKNFLGDNNPFRMVTPKKSDNGAKGNSGNCITRKTVTFGSKSRQQYNTLDLNSKIAALKNTGLFPNISNSDIAKAAGQPRLVRTIKRRLSAKDIRIGPNQEVRRRRTRPLSSNVEVISTTTINTIPSNFFPIRATIPESTNTTNSSKTTSSSSSQSKSPPITSSDCVPSATETTTTTSTTTTTTTTTFGGRRLRKRPERTSPQNSRRNSMSSSSSSNSSTATLPPPAQNAVPMSDLKQSVNKYFGATNRIENGEKFHIRAKRRLTSGHTQYLIEWES